MPAVRPRPMRHHDDVLAGRRDALPPVGLVEQVPPDHRRPDPLPHRPHIADRGLTDLERPAVHDLGVAIEIPVEQRTDVVARVRDEAVHRHHSMHQHSAHRVSFNRRFARPLSRCRIEHRTRQSRRSQVDRPPRVSRPGMARYLDADGVSGREATTEAPRSRPTGLRGGGHDRSETESTLPQGRANRPGHRRRTSGCHRAGVSCLRELSTLQDCFGQPGRHLAGQRPHCGVERQLVGAAARPVVQLDRSRRRQPRRRLQPQHGRNRHVRLCKRR